MAPRGRGGKFSKPSRGGGKHFSRDLQPLDKEGNPIGMWREPGEKPQPSDDEDEDESDSDEEEDSDDDDDDDGGPSKPAVAGELSREQRKEAARLKKQAAIAKKNRKTAAVGDMPSDSDEDEDEDEDGDDDMPANPNHTSKARSQARAVTGPPVDAPKKGDKENLSRREREAIAAQQAKERYQKLHAEGKTDEARADLARLRLIREQREAAAARKQAEKEEKDVLDKERSEREQRKREAAMGGAGAKKPAKGKK